MELSRHSSIILSITIVTTFVSFVKSSLPQGLQTLNISSEISTDPNITASFATDFGNLFNCTPGAVFYPSSPNDIATLIRFSYTSSKPFPISQRGRGHSTYGQTLVPDGILIDMSSLGHTNYSRINVTDGPFPYADVGAEQLWIDVLNATLKRDLMPRMLTDYLYLTVGGTLSNAGISGQEFKHGPQISNVYELDVVTGTGEIVTCSREFNPDLFYAALGGLGQFGVITRARFALEPAQKRVRWRRLFYTDIKLVTSDLEKLISPDNNLSGIIDFVEGEVLLSATQASLIGSTFNFTDSDVQKIIDLASDNNGPIYLVDAVVFYNDTTATSAEQKVDLLLKELQYTSGFAFSNDIPLLNFLNRLHYQETARSSQGQFHPWLSMFVPK
ncbi:Cytokinin oxidase/dehydrogenase [Rhynchospora pubera]|uniref:cytokinin dehydrogenase n=1 Tax=Rhynchospora pubera TaxID=906938 RepID=A0AAV8FBX4_9POAL|nr:Cytokinin oxidase/dehydrogenase [Rhynchospora pubera]